MGNPYYEDDNTIQSAGTARSDPVKAEFAKLETGFDAVDVQLARRIKVPADALTEIVEPADQRALRAIGFDAAGNVSLLSALGTWRGDWSALTAYANQDIVRDPASPHSLYIASEGHESGSAFDSGEKTAHWVTIIDLTELARAEEVAFNFSVITSSQAMVTGGDYAVNCTSPVTLTLPALPSANDHVRIMHVTGDIANLTIGRGGSRIMGLVEDLTFSSTGDNDSTNAAFALIYLNATLGWRIYPV